ncbi:tetratricopeptide repeat protein [Streptomyces lancefieldiae]|uniref:Tetratricopeptide repeat protein n=1 Tax=Streptomyces lancefieldiae TaxID=3075520 RepID=A0ABU3AQJ1_9ACTN|nr:tetratricopeptide repeat protein [Streptomyces sp. DSM 40712]MDT0612095.1 tetratricopeptide repeat protein [Streptomyces sp. DSM 40712]
MQYNFGVIHTGDAVAPPTPTLPLPESVPPRPGLRNLPRPVPHTFVGREEELELLDEAVRQHSGGSAQVVTQAVSGLGGVGKSTLALRWAHRRRASHPAVWWINAETPDSLTESFAQLTRRLNPGTELGALSSPVLAEWGLAWAETHPGALLIFDNATGPEELAGSLARLERSNCLITSRRTHGWHAVTGVSPLHLGVLAPWASAELLRRVSGSEDPVVETLAEVLGHLPLALEHAGAHIRRTAISHSTYMERFHAQAEHLLDVNGHGDPHGITVARTWRLTLDTLADRCAAALPLLRMLAWLAPVGIPRTLPAAAVRNPGEADEALAALADFSMITLTGESIAVHRLVQALSRTPGPGDPHRSPTAIADARNRAVATLVESFPEGDPVVDVAIWPRCRALAPHIEAFIAHCAPERGSLAVADLCSVAAQFFRGQGQFSRAVALTTWAYTSCLGNLGSVHPATLDARHDLARAHREAGDLEHAVALYERNLADRERVLGPHHPDTISARRNLAGAYRENGDLAQAIPLNEQVLADRERLLGPEHAQTLVARNSLALAYQAAGEPLRAVPLHERNLTVCERSFGPRHPETLNSLSNLADAYQEAGDPERALPLHEQTLAASEEVLGPRHPRTILYRSSLALAYQAAGDLERALPLFERTLTDREQVLGPDHPRTAIARANLATACRDAVTGETPSPRTP